MKIYKINALATGYYTVPDVDCPPGWMGSGCYDVDVDCYQEATFSIAANTLEEALDLLDKKFTDFQGHNWSFNVENIYYNPYTVVDEEDKDGGEPEILDYDYEKPVDDDKLPTEYEHEISDFEFLWLKYARENKIEIADPRRLVARYFYNKGLWKGRDGK